MTGIGIRAVLTKTPREIGNVMGEILPRLSAEQLNAVAEAIKLELRRRAPVRR